MNRNNIIGILLIGSIFVIWSVWLSPSKDEIKERQRVMDSIAAVNQANYLRQDSINKANTALANINSSNDSLQSVNGIAGVQSVVDRSKYSVFANSAIGDEKTFTVENDVLKLQFTNKGGRILSAELKDYQTFDSLPLILFDSDTNRFGVSFFVDNHLLNTQDFYFETFWPGKDYSGQDHIKIKGNESVIFGLRLYADNGDHGYNPNQYIEFLYTIFGDKYMIDYKINFVGLKDVLAANSNLNIEWLTNFRKQEKSVDPWNGPTIYYKYASDEVKYLSETKDDDAVLKSKVKWISYKQRFFSATLIANDEFSNADVSVYNDPKAAENPRYLKTMKSSIGIPYSFSGDQTIPMQFYFGPNKFSILRKYHLDLEKQIPLGWSFFLLAWINMYAVIPVFNFLGGFGWNYGIIILILTVLLKLVLFPIAYKTYKSTAKMRVLKPEIDEISQKFPKKEDAMKKQQATMALYKKAGVNPMAGCVPMLLQMPILFAMFRFFPSSIELRQQPFLWATDLSSYDSIWTFANGFSIPFYGDHVSLFTLLMTISTIIYTRINNQMMASGSQQMPGMKTMMYMMPIIFLGVFNKYASGLSYYYFLANIFTFAQMYFIRKTIDEKKILRQIEINKKKPVKKSNFQKRLEEAAKKRGYNPPKR